MNEGKKKDIEKKYQSQKTKKNPIYKPFSVIN